MPKKVKSLSIPSIISAKTYFWSPSGASSTRRRSEERRRAEVEAFLNECGLAAQQNGCFTNGAGLEVRFHYSESCRNIYKSFEVFRNGRKSNIKGFAAELRKTGIELV